MAKSCSHRKISLAYPKHLPAPEDLLHFIESTEFTADWAALGLDDEDDMVSLQLCVMSHPEGDSVVAGTSGLRVHRHFIHRASEVRRITTYYAYFPDFGVVYLNCVDTSRAKLKFTDEQIVAINAAILEVETELERLKTIRVRQHPSKGRLEG